MTDGAGHGDSSKLIKICFVVSSQNIRQTLNVCAFDDATNKQVGEMDNTDVSSDYTSNCLPPNCLPR